MKAIKVKNKINVMKIINGLILLIVVAGVFFACDPKLQTLDSSNFHIRFSSSSRDITESNQVVKVPITLAAPKQSSALEIEYEISGNAVAGKDYSLSNSGRASIGAGLFADTIRITLLNDFDADGAKTLVFTLKSSSNGIKAGLGVQGKVFTLNIADDDCAFNIDDFVGNFDVEITSEAGFGLPAGLYTTETSLKKGTSANTLIDENFWDFGPNSVTITLDPSDPSKLTASLVGTQQVYINAAGLPRFAIQGTQPLGSFNTCQKSVTVRMELTRQDGVTVANRSVIKYTKK